MRAARTGTTWPRIVGLLEDGKARSNAEIAEALGVTYSCVNLILRESRRGFYAKRIRIADWRKGGQGKQIALFLVGNEPDAQPAKVIR